MLKQAGIGCNMFLDIQQLRVCYKIERLDETNCGNVVSVFFKWLCFASEYFEKSRVRETKHLSTDSR